METWLMLQALPEFWTTTAKVIAVSSIAGALIVSAVIGLNGLGFPAALLCFIVMLAAVGFSAMTLETAHGRKNVEEMKKIIAEHVEKTQDVTMPPDAELYSFSGEPIRKNYRYAQNISFQGVNTDRETVDVKVSWLELDTDMTEKNISSGFDPITLKVTSLPETTDLTK